MDLLNLRFVGDENRGLNLILPNTASKELLDKISKKDLLTLTVTGEGQIERNGDNIEISDLARFVKENLDKNEYIIVSIKVKENVVYKQFVEVLDQVGKSGCKRILIPESIQ